MELRVYALLLLLIKNVSYCKDNNLSKLGFLKKKKRGLRIQITFFINQEGSSYNYYSASRVSPLTDISLLIVVMQKESKNEKVPKKEKKNCYQEMMKNPATPHEIKNNRRRLTKRSYAVKLFLVFHIDHLIIIVNEVVFCEII